MFAVQPYTGRTGESSTSESSGCCASRAEAKNEVTVKTLALGIKLFDMNTTQILKDLDKHAAEFNFPVLDNAYVEFAAARLSAFQGAKDWLIVFEVLGFSTKEGEFVDDLYAFGSCIEREGFVGEEIPLTSSRKLPIFNAETNQCIADWSRWSIRVGNEEMSFSPTPDEYADAGIMIDRKPRQATLNEID